MKQEPENEKMKKIEDEKLVHVNGGTDDTDTVIYLDTDESSRKSTEAVTGTNVVTY